MDNSEVQFTIRPAIDLRAGEVVRLIQGDRSRQKTYFQNPGEVAQMWIEAGASWLHVVNLDGAFGENGVENLRALEDIIRSAKNNKRRVNIQFGGGLRAMSDVERAINAGVSRVVLGTAAVKSPQLVSEAINKFGQVHVGLALDARHNLVHTHGWEKSAPVDPITFGKSMYTTGIRTCVFTNIERDGGLQGADIRGSKLFADKTKLEVIVSGGLSSLDEIRLVRKAGLAGVIIGKALYEGKFKLEEAIEC